MFFLEHPWWEMVKERSALFEGNRPGNHDDLPRLDSPYDSGQWRKVQTLLETRTGKAFLTVQDKSFQDRFPLPEVFVVERTAKSKVDLHAVHANLMMQRLCNDCENIGKIYGIWQDDKYVYTASEHCGHDVFTWVSVLRGRKDVCIDHLLLGYVRQMLAALKALHSKGLAHMDVCLENFYVAKDNKLKLVGFERACNLASQDSSVHGSAAASHIPPEFGAQLAGDPQQVDCYQLGKAIFTLLAGKNPAPSSSHDSSGLAEALRSLPCYHLLQVLLEPRPGVRPTVEDALQDPWLQGGEHRQCGGQLVFQSLG